ncbi:unnamed protein product [Rotaria sp. Silwood1]|nr:unnamed protein product [Rotaria sp. Silwood1]
MASESESNQCSMCQKNTGKCICDGCKNYFCIKHFNQHRQQLSIKFDDEIVTTHDELLEQINRKNQSNDCASKLFDEINRWETVTIEKIHKSAEQARDQLTQILTQEKDKLIQELGIMKKEICDRRDEDDFDENDIERLRQKLNQIQISLEQFIRSTTTKVIIVTNNQIDWNRFIYIEKQATSKSICSTSATSTSFGKTAQTTTTSVSGTTNSTAIKTSPFTDCGSTAPARAAKTIFGVPVKSTATTTAIFDGSDTQTIATDTIPLSCRPTRPSSMFNPQSFTGFSLTQTQPAASTATSSYGFVAPFGSTTIGFSAPTNITQTQNQEKFFSASLLDPFAHREKQDFNNIDQIKSSINLIAVSTSSITPTTVTTSTSSPIALPLQSNSRNKPSSTRPLVDIGFKLKPVSPSTSWNITNDEIKSSNQPTKSASGLIERPLTTDNSDDDEEEEKEEEPISFRRSKISKKSLSNDSLNSSFQSESTRSLYPLERLAELETLANMNNNTNILSTVHATPSLTTVSTTNTTSAHISSTTVNNEQSLYPAIFLQHMLPFLHSTPVITHKQSSLSTSSPSTILVQSLTSVLPPPTSTNSIQQTKSSHDYDYTNITKSNSISNTYHLPKLTREYYYMRPSMSELKSLFDDQDQCIVEEFTVGHEKYGSITFYGQVNVAGLDLDRIIKIDRHEAIVYPDDNNKPPVGKELNIPARITLYGVYPIDRITQKEITDIERIKAMNYNDYLREVTKQFDGEFINYSITDGSWTFMVKHFTRYGLDNSKDDFVAVVVKQPQQVTKPINANFLDQTIAFALTLLKFQSIDLKEKGNTTSLIDLRPNIVEQLVQLMFCDDIRQVNDRMVTSTKIITPDDRTIPITHKPIIEKHTQIIFNIPIKFIYERVYSKLSKNIANIRGKYFRTSYYSEYESIDFSNRILILLQILINFNQQTVHQLENFLKVCFTLSIQQIEENSNMPYFQGRQASYVQQFIEFYTKTLDEVSSMKRTSK